MPLNHKLYHGHLKRMVRARILSNSGVKQEKSNAQGYQAYPNLSPEIQQLPYQIQIAWHGAMFLS